MQASEFTCTPEDFLQAQRLHHTLSLRGRRFFTRIGLWSGALALVFAILAQRRGLNPVVAGLAVAVSYAVVTSILILTTRIFSLPRNSRRQFLQRKGFGGIMSYEIRSPNIVVKSTSAFSETPTEHFLKWAEDKKTILLYRSDNMFHFIPKRAIDDGFYAGLKAELARAAVPRAVFSNS